MQLEDKSFVTLNSRVIAKAKSMRCEVQEKGGKTSDQKVTLKLQATAT